MEVDIKFKTPGAHLSMNSMYGVISELKREIEKGIIDALKEEYPHVSKSSLKRKVKKDVDLYLTNAQKGSWEITLATVVGSAIGSIIYNLISDLIVSTDAWDSLKTKIYSTSERASNNVVSRLKNKKKIGPFLIKKNESSVIKNKNKTTKLSVNLELDCKNNSDQSFDVEKEVDGLIRQLKDRNQKK